MSSITTRSIPSSAAPGRSPLRRRAAPPRHGPRARLRAQPHGHRAGATIPGGSTSSRGDRRRPPRSGSTSTGAPRRSSCMARCCCPFLGDHYGRVLARGELRPALRPRRGDARGLVSRAPVPARSADLSGGAGRAARRAPRPPQPRPARARARRPGVAARRRGGRRRATRAGGGGRQPAARAGARRARALRPALDRCPRDSLSGGATPPLVCTRCSSVSTGAWPSGRSPPTRSTTGASSTSTTWPACASSARRSSSTSTGWSLRLIAEGRLDGLRIDHVDGLFDPRGYCRRLADAAGAASGSWSRRSSPPTRRCATGRSRARPATTS